MSPQLGKVRLECRGRWAARFSTDTGSAFTTDGPGLGEAAFPTDNGLQRKTDVEGGGVLAKGMGPSHPLSVWSRSRDTISSIWFTSKRLPIRCERLPIRCESVHPIRHGSGTPSRHSFPIPKHRTTTEQLLNNDRRTSEAHKGKSDSPPTVDRSPSGWYNRLSDGGEKGETVGKLQGNCGRDRA